MEVINLECPHCGAAVSTGDKICEYCKKPVIITSFSALSAMPLPEINKCANSYRKTLAAHPDNKDINISIAFCYLRLKLYDKAIPAFEKGIENNFDNADVFFYAAVALLKGQKAFVTPRADINKCLEYIDAAMMIEPKGIYQYFLAYIKYDYFKRKYLNISPDWRETLTSAYNDYGVTDADIDGLYALLGVARPDCL